LHQQNTQNDSLKLSDSQGYCLKEEKRRTLRLSFLLLFKNAVWDLLANNPCESAHREKLDFETCIQTAGDAVSQGREYKALHGHKSLTISSKADIISALRTARANKLNLSYKFKMSLSELTKSSAILIKASIDDIDNNISENQLVFLEMPATNLIASYNQHDPLKKFVFDLHKSLGTMLKLVQGRPQQSFLQPKKRKRLSGDLLSLLTQEALLFSWPCEAVLMLQIPRESQNWRVCNLGLKYIEQIRGYCVENASVQQVKEEIGEAMRTIEQELSAMSRSIRKDSE